jgi:homoserine kinase type II
MAVYTEVTDEDLARFLARYDVGGLKSYKGIAEGVENTNYLVYTGQGPLILTLYEKRVARGDLPFFLGLMEHLAAGGIHCPLPVRDRAGNMLGELAGRPAAIVTFLEGYWLRQPEPRHCHAVGQALAGLHLAGADFALPRRNALGIDGWRPLFERFEPRADEIAADLASTIRAELAFLEAAWPRDLASGVIHADLFPDNVFFLEDTLSGLIDFYFACNDALAYDVAICLNAWCFDAACNFDPAKGGALLSGYQELRPLASHEREALPMLARGAALRFLLTRAYDWLHTPANALVKPHDPMAYLQRLAFHQGVDGFESYGWEPK